MPQHFFRNTLPSDLEAIMSIGASAALEPIAGLSGILAGALGGSQAGVDAIKQMQGYAYQPRDPATLNSIGSALQVPLEYYEKGTNALGDAGNYIGGPIGGAIGKSLPEIAAAGFGLRQMAKAGAKNSTGAPEFDESRRKFIRNTGLATAGAVAAPALLKKGLFDVATAPSVATIATGTAKAIPTVSPSMYSAVQTLKALVRKRKTKADKDAFLDRIKNEGFDEVYEHIGKTDYDFNLQNVDLDEAIELAKMDKIHMNELEPVDMTYGMKNPLNSYVDGARNQSGLYSRSLPSDLDGKIIEGIASRTIRPESFKADLRKHMDGISEELDYDLAEPEIRYLDEILDSGDPIGELFQRSSIDELDMFGEVTPREWLGRDKWGRVSTDRKIKTKQWKDKFEQERFSREMDAWPGDRYSDEFIKYYYDKYGLEL